MYSIVQHVGPEDRSISQQYVAFQSMFFINSAALYSMKAG